jgi:hypothetical protein
MMKLSKNMKCKGQLVKYKGCSLDSIKEQERVKEFNDVICEKQGFVNIIGVPKGIEPPPYSYYIWI